MPAITRASAALSELSETETAALIRLSSRLGYRYDLKNVTRPRAYTMPTPARPDALGRRMIALGSGDPTRAICSTLLAPKLSRRSVIPILPLMEVWTATPEGRDSVAEQMHIRHHSLFTPRVISTPRPIFRSSPTLAAGFDFHKLSWGAEPSRAELGNSAQ